MKKWLPIVLVIVLAIAVFLLKRSKDDDKALPKPKTTTDKPKPYSPKINRDHGFDRRISFLKYSHHANCRMNCRHITQTEVEGIMQDGTINYKKSDLQNVKCPRYAVESTTPDGQRVRVVFAQCNESTTVVTVIDLKTEFECHCPGDDK